MWWKHTHLLIHIVTPPPRLYMHISVSLSIIASIGNTKMHTISRSSDVCIFLILKVSLQTVVGIQTCRHSIITSRQTCVFSHRSIVIFLLPMLPCHHWNSRVMGLMVRRTLFLKANHSSFHGFSKKTILLFMVSVTKNINFSLPTSDLIDLRLTN